MKHRVLIIAFLLALLPAAQQAGAFDRFDLRDLAFEAMSRYEEKGYTVRNEIQMGMLFPGEAYYFEKQLSMGLEYFFYAAGGPDSKAFKIEMFDENFRMVAADVMLAPEAEVIYAPDWSGTFHIKVTLMDAPEQGGYWFVISGYK